MRTTQAERGRTERRKRAAAEIQNMIADLYRGFVAWASLYADPEGRHERDQRERVAGLMDRLSNGYLARSMWLEPGTRRRVEGFVEGSEDLYSRFCAEIEDRGYDRVRKGMANRVSRRLGSLKKDTEFELQDEPERSRLPWPLRQRRPAE